MHYVSTRGEAPPLGFCRALLAGLARDGGLYLPQTWPMLEPDAIAGFAGRSLMPGRAKRVIGPFVDGEIEPQDLRAHGRARPMRASAIPPSRRSSQIGDNLFVLELFHGPTLAFKDVAMQLLGRLMDHVLRASGASAPPSSARPRATPAARRSRRSAASSRSTSFILYPQAASPTSSAGR